MDNLIFPPQVAEDIVLVGEEGDRSAKQVLPAEPKDHVETFEVVSDHWSSKYLNG